MLRKWMLLSCIMKEDISRVFELVKLMAETEKFDEYTEQWGWKNALTMVYLIEEFEYPYDFGTEKMRQIVKELSDYLMLYLPERGQKEIENHLLKLNSPYVE